MKIQMSVRSVNVVLNSTSAANPETRTSSITLSTQTNSDIMAPSMEPMVTVPLTASEASAMSYGDLVELSITPVKVTQ